MASLGFLFYVLFPSTLSESNFVLVAYFSGILVIICSLGLFWGCHCARGYLSLSCDYGVISLDVGAIKHPTRPTNLIM